MFISPKDLIAQASAKEVKGFVRLEWEGVKRCLTCLHSDADYYKCKMHDLRFSDGDKVHGMSMATEFVCDDWESIKPLEEGIADPNIIHCKDCPAPATWNVWYEDVTTEPLTPANFAYNSLCSFHTLGDMMNGRDGYKVACIKPIGS